MSLINSKNKQNTVKLENNKLLYRVPKIEDTDLIKKPNHYFNYGYRDYNLINRKLLVFSDEYTTDTESFSFDMDEKFIPFTKLISKLESNHASKISFILNHTWNILSGGKVNLIVSYTYYNDYQTDDSYSFTGYFTLDLAIKNFVLPTIAHGSQL